MVLWLEDRLRLSVLLRLRVLLWRRIGGGGGCSWDYDRLSLAEDREGCVGGYGGLSGGFWEEVCGRCSCWVLRDSSGMGRLNSLVLRDRRSCRWSDCPGSKIVVLRGRPLPLREGGVPIVASPPGPGHGLEVDWLAVLVRHF